MEFKICTGYEGHFECGDKYPDRMLPTHLFYDKQCRCKSCQKYGAIKWHNEKRPRHPQTGQWKMEWKAKYAKSLGGRRGDPNWKDLLNKAEEQWSKEIIEWKINGKVMDITPRFKFDDEITYSTQKEQVKRKRDSKVVSYIRSVYDSCSVVGCDYLDYEVAHIHALKHGADDLPENCLALCPNHHRDLDRGRMTPLRQLDVGGYIYFGEQGIKLKHKVDSKYLDQCNLELEEWKNGTNKVQSENDRPSLAVGE